mgnify:CR=1 FL=1
MRLVGFIASFICLLSLRALSAEEAADTRSCWVYEGGWFAKEKAGGWYEMNEETHLLGKPWKFKEVKRSKEAVELYDEARAVTVRLTDAVLETRWDKDGKDAEWKLLLKGRWKKRE